MIGNDIVDLQAASKESNWRRPGYLQKIFSTEEQQQIKATREPDLLVWIFWSMKEAAYKAHQRKFNLCRSFNPSKISSFINQQEDSSVLGKVRIDDSIYTTETSVKESNIFTTATATEATKIFSKIYPSSANVKELLLEEISVRYNIPQANFSIKKNKNAVPVLELRSRTNWYPFSISHHGNFAAFSVPLMKD